tara:strand:- start:511 stop:942 length:432 start_codon:yes stop_codon:yes gene_type:complete
MSADPLTLISIGKTFFDIKESKKQSKIEQQQFEHRKKLAAERAAQEEEDRLDDLRMSHAHNLAVAAGAGYSDDSRGFLNVQDQNKIKADKDIARIRLNVKNQINEYSIAQNLRKSERKQEQFGGWLSIASAGVEAKYKKDTYG